MQQWSLDNLLQFLDLFLTPANIIVRHIWLLLYLGGRGGEGRGEGRGEERRGEGREVERRGEGSGEERGGEGRGGEGREVEGKGK